MRTIEFTPSKEGWTGTVSLEMPSYLERIKLLKELNLKGSGKEVEISDETWDMAAKMVEISQKYTNGVELSFNGKEFRSLEDLEYYKEGVEVINEIAQTVINGVRLGND